MLRLKAGGHGHAARAHLAATVGGERHAVGFVLIFVDGGAIVNARAQAGGSMEQRVREAIGIDLRGVIGKQPGRVIERKAVLDVVAFEEIEPDAGGAARFVLVAHGGDIALGAGKVEAFLWHVAAVVAQFFGQLADLVDGFKAEVVAAHGVLTPNHADQVGQVCVDFILQERGAGAGAAGGNVAPVEHNHADASFGKVVGHQRASDAAANHGHIAAQVFGQGGVASDQAIFDRPERIARFKIHEKLHTRREHRSRQAPASSASFTEKGPTPSRPHTWRLHMLRNRVCRGCTLRAVKRLLL